MRNLLLVLFALVLVAGMAKAQPVTNAASVFTATVSTDLEVAEKSAGTASGLAHGVTYTVLPDPNIANPFPFLGAEASNPTEFTVTSDGGTNLVISFILPTKLVGPQGSLGASFGPQSLMHEGTGALYNPNVPNTFEVGSDGTFDLGLGITIAVPQGVAAADYVGTIVCMATLSGM